MAISKVKLPDNTVENIHDSRVVSDEIAYVGETQGSATYTDGEYIIDVTTKADKVQNANAGNLAELSANGNLVDSGYSAEDFQPALISGTNIKTINNQSLLGSGNINVSGGSGGGGISDVILGESSVVSEGIATLPAYPTTLPASDVSSWAKQPDKPTYTANEVGALPSSTSIPTESTVTGWGFTKNAGTITGITMNGSSKGTSGVVDLGTVITSHQDISGKANESDVVHKTGNESISGAKTFSDPVLIGYYIEGPSADFSWLHDSNADSVQDALDAKQNTLVSGTNIKTINNTSILGNGNITTGTYSKPSTGIPKTDLATAVQTSLDKADTALQSYTETDPVFTASAAHGISSTDISNWNAKQKAITVSSSAPISSQGSNGDIWIVI